MFSYDSRFRFVIPPHSFFTRHSSLFLYLCTSFIPLWLLNHLSVEYPGHLGRLLLRQLSRQLSDSQTTKLANHCFCHCATMHCPTMYDASTSQRLNSLLYIVLNIYDLCVNPTIQVSFLSFMLRERFEGSPKVRYLVFGLYLALSLYHSITLSLSLHSSSSLVARIPSISSSISRSGGLPT
jgi:hypothetical protein